MHNDKLTKKVVYLYHWLEVHVKMLNKLFYLLFIFSLFVIAIKSDTSTQNEHKIIIDNDAGADDSIAIFMTLLYEKYYGGPQLIGLTTANGNTNESNVLINNQKILRTAKRQDVPIYRGSISSLVLTPPVTPYFGEDGLGDNNETLAGLVPPQNERAVIFLLEMSKKHEGKLTVVAIGPVTNIALAIKVDPDFLGRLEHLYIGAGHIYSEVHSEPEFNAHMDVEAYEVVAQHATPEKVTFIPFSQVYSYLSIDLQWRINTFGTIDTDIVRAINVYEQVTLHKEDSWNMLDPVVVATALSNIPSGDGQGPDLCTGYKYSKNGIIMCGEQRGLNTNNFVAKEDANVRIGYSFDLENYKTFLIDVFTAELTSKY